MDPEDKSTEWAENRAMPTCCTRLPGHPADPAGLCSDKFARHLTWEALNFACLSFASGVAQGFFVGLSLALNETKGALRSGVELSTVASECYSILDGAQHRESRPYSDIVCRGMDATAVLGTVLRPR